jgi:hypothetical protein
MTVRRAFISTLGAVFFVATLAAGAQQAAKIPRIGYLLGNVALRDASSSSAGHWSHTPPMVQVC